MAVSYPALIEEIKQLTVEEQLALREVLDRLIRSAPSSEMRTPGSVAKLRGILKPEGAVPTDEELSDAYTDYSIKKWRYSLD